MSLPPSRPGISVRPISRARLAVELDASAGISYNGTTTTVVDPDRALRGDIRYRCFYMAEGEELSREDKLVMIGNERLILDMLPPEDHQKAREQIQEYRNELSTKDTKGI